MRSKKDEGVVGIENRNCADVRAAAMVVPNPGQFFLCVGVRMPAVQSVGFRLQGLLGVVIQLVPPHEGRLGDVIPP